MNEPGSAKRTTLRIVGIVVLLVAALAGGTIVLLLSRVDENIEVTVRIDGTDQVVSVASSARVSDAFVAAGFAPHNGRLLSAGERNVLDPRHDPAIVRLDGDDAGDAHPLVDGVLIEAIDGSDEIEETEIVEAEIPVPPLRETLQHVYVAGEPGLAEREIGVRSREIVEERILEEVVPARRTRRQVVALTIDDGPHEVWTPLMLDVLKKRKVKATFCLIGENVERHPDLAKRIVDEGHRICNHTVTHDTGLDGASREHIDDEIGGAARIFTTAGLPSPGYYRPPGGVLNDEIREVAWSYDQHVIHWQVDTEDWRGDATLTSILENVDRDVDPGAIILLHDGGGDRQLSVFAAALIIDHLEAQGYDFVFPFIEG